MNNDLLNQQSNDYLRIEQAMRYIEAHLPEQPDLETLARSVNLSPWHFQRLFSRWAGLSPGRFLRCLTLEHARQRLNASQALLDTALDTGLSGSGRLHDLFVTFEAMTPGEYRTQGSGLHIAYGFHPTPFGECLLAVTERGICSLYFVTDTRDSLLQILEKDWRNATLSEQPRRTQAVVEHLFVPAHITRPLHLMLKGTNFQVQVWRALLQIPPGAVLSYQDVARWLGRPTATRAVAAAIARNPISYLIPCHRVINRLGEVHGYRWGTARKRALLGREACQLPDKNG